MNYEDFLATKVEMTKTGFSSVYGSGILTYDKVIVYADGLFVEVMGKDKFTTTIDRSEYVENDLTKLEKLLYAYYLEEI